MLWVLHCRFGRFITKVPLIGSGAFGYIRKIDNAIRRAIGILDGIREFACDTLDGRYHLQIATTDLKQQQRAD